MQCPNCGCDVPDRVVAYWWCSECGTHWDKCESFVPRRSKPVQPVDLPDSDGYWWEWEPVDKKWILIEVLKGNDDLLSGCCTGVDDTFHLPRGRYVRAVPPIVAEPKDEDAEWLRICSMSTIYGQADVHRMRRIADEYERLKRQVREGEK